MKSYLMLCAAVLTVVSVLAASGGQPAKAVPFVEFTFTPPCTPFPQCILIDSSPTPVVVTQTSPTPVVEQVASPTPTPSASPNTGSISGTVYLDNNGDGVKNSGDTGISGVTVKLTGNTETAAVKGALVAAAVSQSTTTDPNGNYSFSGLSAGSYTVTESQPACADGNANVGSLGGSAGTNQVSTISVTSGANGTAYNFGERPPCNFANFADTGQPTTVPLVAGLLLTIAGLGVLRIRRAPTH